LGPYRFPVTSFVLSAVCSSPGQAEGRAEALKADREGDFRIANWSMEGVRMDKVNWGLIAPLLAVVGLISLARTEQVRGPKWMWVLLLVFGNLLGSIAYFTLGRKEL
jgi:hypothetical protein